MSGSLVVPGANGARRHRFGIIIRAPKMEDVDAVAEMRNAWYAKIGKPVVPTPPQAQWMVAEWALTGKVVAAMAVIPPELLEGRAFITEIYCAEGREGKFGIRAFAEKLDELPARKATSVPAENEAMQNLLKSAGYRVTELTFEKDQTCPEPSPPSLEASSA